MGLVARCMICYGVCMAAVGQAFAAVVVLGDRADRTIRSDGTTQDKSFSRVGAGTESPGQGARSLVFVFQLPSPAAGELPIVVQASLGFTIITDLDDGGYNIDLYALPARDASAVLFSDGFAGAQDTSATLIQDNIIPSANSYIGPVVTSTDANEALVQYLNGIYGLDGTGAGKWVFLRLNPDLDPPAEVSGVEIAQANNATGKPDSQKPALTIAFVPEPTRFTLLVAGIIINLSRRAGKTRML